MLWDPATYTCIDAKIFQKDIKREDYVYGKGEYRSTYVQLHENKASKKQGIIILWDINIFANTYA